ncbi:hypothetical protein HanRHA438_Chr10g0440421 [Helianthus annuus]|nr:hypothetical protein HanRHA438_Chr10g0440421 [Helianthus annuus]
MVTEGDEDRGGGGGGMGCAGRRREEREGAHLFAPSRTSKCGRWGQDGGGAAWRDDGDVASPGLRTAHTVQPKSHGSDPTTNYSP